MRYRFLQKAMILGAILGMVFILLWATRIDDASAQTETPPIYPPLSGIIAIAAESNGSTCALTENGGVECWGKAGSTGAENILKIREAVALASGGQHSCVITRSGGVQCWGYNSDGQLGDGTTETTENSYRTAVDVKGLPGKVTALGLGFSFSCVVIEGEVWCWGQNDYGQLGDGTTTNRSIPEKVDGLTGEITAITAGTSHTCALNTSGTVQCWGGNIGSMLGNLAIDTPSTPVSVSGLVSGVVMITSRDAHTCALTSEGTVFCWGMNESGQLGNGETTFASDAPVPVSGLPEDVSAISTGVHHTCAMTSEGQVLCWGDNRAGELGDGSNIDRLTPVTVNGLSNKVTAIAAGRDYTCAIVDGGVKCWGENNTDQLGTGIDPNRDTPVSVTGLTGVSAIAAGGETSCALMGNGSVECWGNNEHSQVGDGTDVDRSLPVKASGIEGKVFSLSIGMGHTCILLSNGDIQCWGSNTHGVLGNGAFDYRGSKTAVSVSSLPGKATVVSVGNNHTCAIIDRSVYCWGGNDDGQLGDGTTEDRSTPTAISELGGIAAMVSAGFNYTCALTDGGAVLCWGNNQDGQLGDGTTEDRSTPMAVSGLNSGIVSIAAGEHHTCALTDTGNVKCWGQNTDRQLGDGTTESSLVPVNVNGLSGKAVAIAANLVTCALLDTGGLQCWGEGYLVGGGNLSGLTSGVRGIAMGRFHACAVLENGSVQCWGANSNGQLGNGAGPDSSTPLTVVLGPRREETETGGYRESGPLIPKITTYIPTPLDVSTQPSVIGTNLFLAALLMLPFAVATEVFTRTLAEHEGNLRKKFHPVEWISRLQKRLGEISGTKFGKRPALRDTLKLIGVIVFYGLVFSLLDRTWKPFSLQGLILFLSMTIAYGVVGIADDIIQWRTIQKWGLRADLIVRPTNFLLAMASTTTSRLLYMVPGLMFGTPEALQTEEGQFDEPKRYNLLKISAKTFIFIGLGVWLPTIVTALLQRLPLSENTINLIGGLEGFLLVIFAVSLENLFVQMLGFPGGFGQALKHRNKLLWGAALTAVTFLFYHTLINPRGELAEALETGNVRLFLSMAASFVVVAFGLWVYFKWQARRIAMPSKVTPVPVVTAIEPEVPPIAPLPSRPVVAMPTPSSVSPKLPMDLPQKIIEVQHPTPVPAEVQLESSFISINETKACPVCCNQIKAEARVCRFCKATFVVIIRGYCLNDHDLMETTAEGKCTHCGNQVADLQVESRLLKAPAVLSVQAAQVAVVPAKVQTNMDATGDTKTCPACGQLIKSEAKICRFCRARFEVRERGYCLNDHAIVEAKDGKCVQCGDAAQDIHIESTLIKSPTTLQSTPTTKTEQSTKQPVTKVRQSSAQHSSISTPAEKLKRPGCVTAYVVLLLLGAGIFVLTGISGGSAASYAELGPAVGTVITTVAFVIAAIYVVIAIGLWQLKNWARVIIMVVVGLGVALGIISIAATIFAPPPDVPAPLRGAYSSQKVIGIFVSFVALAINSSIFDWFKKNKKYFDQPAQIAASAPEIVVEQIRPASIPIHTTKAVQELTVEQTPIVVDQSGAQCCPRCNGHLNESNGSPVSPYINTYACEVCGWVGLKCGETSCYGYLVPQEMGYPNSVRYNCAKCNWTGLGPRVAISPTRG